MSDPAASGAPPCAPPDPNPRKPRLVLPPLACDSHAHILGPASRYAYSPARTYTPPDALLPAYEHLLKTLGVARAVLVQPSVYGSDNTAMLDAMKVAGNRFRGVAVVKEDISEAELRKLHDAGVRGVRFNIVDVKDGKRGTLPLDAPKKLAQRVRSLGWHVEFLMHVDEFPDLDRAFADFPVDIVLGHLGYTKTDKGLDAPGYQAMLRLVKSGRCWVKLTGPYRISAKALPYPDVTQFAHALMKANPERILWGSDWPHVTTKVMPNDGDLCDLLSDWIPAAELREQVLVKNPAKLYGFN
jgi:predicted TIM-barrel fold metal-dependent hydrolase